MNTEEIKTIGKKYFGENFIDCISWDNIWKIKSYCNTQFTDRCKTKFLVANLDESNQSGTHWIVICNIPNENDKHNVKFGIFDSFGLFGMNNVFKTTNKDHLNLMLKQFLDGVPINKHERKTYCTCFPNSVRRAKYLFSLISTVACTCDNVFSDIPSYGSSNTVVSYNFYPSRYVPDICNRKLQLLFEQLNLVNANKIKLEVSKKRFQNLLSKTCGELCLLFIDMMDREFNEKKNRSAFEDTLDYMDRFTEKHRYELPNIIALKAKEIFQDDYQFKKSYMLSEEEINTGRIIN